MALHTKIPIYRAGLDLLALAHRVQEQMPRGAKRTVGEKIAQHCIDILELMALANASREQRAHYLRELLVRQRAVEVLLRVSFEARHVSPKLWAQSVQVLGSIGAQAGGWLKTAANHNRAPAA